MTANKLPPPSESWWSRQGHNVLAALAVTALVGVVLYLFVLKPPAGPPGTPLSSERKSTPGWETRYPATFALAHRGSPATNLDVLAESLDESQQLVNFLVKQADGREVSDEQIARRIVLLAMEAVGSLHEKRPTLDLTPLQGAIDKLTRSENLTLRDKAIDLQKRLKS